MRENTRHRSLATGSNLPLTAIYNLLTFFAKYSKHLPKAKLLLNLKMRKFSWYVYAVGLKCGPRNEYGSGFAVVSVVELMVEEKKALICRNVLAGDPFGSQRRRNMRSNQGKRGGGVTERERWGAEREIWADV